MRVGTSGWVYPHWKNGFYPPGLRASDQLAFYATRFDTVEINGSFYRLPTEAAVAGSAERAPEGFLYAWKASRYITGAKKLRDVGDSVELVFRRMAPLGTKLGPALFQLPPQLARNDERLASFLQLLPKGARVAIEFRRPDWYADDIFSLLERHDVALCVSDHHAAPCPWRATASFVYVRGHGPGGRYFGRYGEGELDAWAERIAVWRGEGRDVFAYFDNDIGGAAPLDAAALMARLAI